MIVGQRTTNSIKVNRIFIHDDLGQFGFNQFYSWKDEKWVWIDLEVDVDPETLKIFRSDKFVQFQIWLADDRTRLGLASNFHGHLRQVFLPLKMLEKVKVEFARPAKGGGEFDMSIDNKDYQGQIIGGGIKLSRKDHSWDMLEYEEKKKSLKEIVDSILNLTQGQLTRTLEVINA